MRCREELQEYDAFDEGVFCRSRTWLFLSYVVSFGAVTAAVWVLLQDYALNEAATQTWPGVAGLFQVSSSLKPHCGNIHIFHARCQTLRYAMLQEKAACKTACADERGTMCR